MSNRLNDIQQALKEPLEEDNGQRLDLDGACYATLEGGIIRLKTASAVELFSIDANTVAFERKLLGAMIQVYLLGLNRGRITERGKIKENFDSVVKLIFDKD